MAILGVPFKLTGADVGASDLGPAIARGMQIGFAPRKMAQELLSAKLQNEINASKAKYAERNALADLGLKEAQTQHYLRPEKPSYSNFEKAVQGAKRIEEQYGKDSQEAKLANAYVQRISQGQNGTQFTIDPETGAITYTQGGYGRNAPASQITTDEHGNPVQVSSPTTPLRTAQQKASISEIGRQHLANNLEMPYLGTLSNSDLLWDRLRYSLTGDKEAGDKLVKAAVANMLVPEYAALQLSSQGVPATVPGLEHQGQVIRQGWPGLTERIVNNLPKLLQEKAKKMHAQVLADIKAKREKHISSGFPIKLNKKSEEISYSPAKGESVPMYKKGVLHFIPVEDVDEAKTLGYKHER